MEQVPDIASKFEPDNPGMHVTDTVDYAIVLEGEVWLELDDGAQHHLEAHDVVIQNGTRHAWRNKTNRPVKMVFVMIGAQRVRPDAREPRHGSDVDRLATIAVVENPRSSTRRLVSAAPALASAAVTSQVWPAVWAEDSHVAISCRRMNRSALPKRSTCSKVPQRTASFRSCAPSRLALS